MIKVWRRTTVPHRIQGMMMLSFEAKALDICLSQSCEERVVLDGNFSC